jgi:hypothetical protein
MLVTLFSIGLSPLIPFLCWPCSLLLMNDFCGVLNSMNLSCCECFRYTKFMWHVAALRELIAHAQREIAELRDVSLGSANKIVRLEDTCWVSPYNIGRYVLSRENHVSPLKRSGNYTYRQVGRMKHCLSPDGACVYVQFVTWRYGIHPPIGLLNVYTLRSLWEANRIYTRVIQ